MRVRCLADHLSDEQLGALGRPPYRGGRAWGLTMGEEYLVLGLSFAVNPKQPLTGPYVFLLLQRDNVLSARGYDLGLFTITDPHPSRYWEVRAWEYGENQIVDLLPPALAAELYVPTSAGSDGSVEDDAWFAYLDSEGFRQLCDRLRGESDRQNMGK